jgi:hypothetical protein
MHFIEARNYDTFKHRALWWDRQDIFTALPKLLWLTMFGIANKMSKRMCWECYGNFIHKHHRHYTSFKTRCDLYEGYKSNMKWQKCYMWRGSRVELRAFSVLNASDGYSTRRKHCAFFEYQSSPYWVECLAFLVLYDSGDDVWRANDPESYAGRRVSFW